MRHSNRHRSSLRERQGLVSLHTKLLIPTIYQPARQSATTHKQSDREFLHINSLRLHLLLEQIALESRIQIEFFDSFQIADRFGK